MATLGLPKITITFSEKAAQAIARSDRGVVGLVLIDTAKDTNPIIVTSVADIPTTLTADNQEYIKLALMGHTSAVKKVICYVVAAVDDVVGALGNFLTTDVSFLAVPDVGEKAKDVASWVKSVRGNENASCIEAVLPNCAEDYEGVINFTADGLNNGTRTFTTAQYCARIAGILATTPLTSSATYFTLSDIISLNPHTRSEINDSVGKGEFTAFFDGEKIKTARAVNSLTTIADGRSDQWKKIKVVTVMDIIKKDIKTTIEDEYIGKVNNTYANKLLLKNAINAYFETLVQEGALISGYCDIDVDAQRTYLKSTGTDVTKMTDAEIKEANTGDKVFLNANVEIADVMEEINLPIEI